MRESRIANPESRISHPESVDSPIHRFTDSAIQRFRDLEFRIRDCWILNQARAPRYAGRSVCRANEPTRESRIANPELRISHPESVDSPIHRFSDSGIQD